MFSNLLLYAASLHHPATGDTGLPSIVLVLIILCSAILIGCLIWAVILYQRKPKIETTVFEDTELEQTLVEDIEPHQPADESQEPTVDEPTEESPQEDQ